jgi:hypothetical protein
MSADNLLLGYPYQVATRKIDQIAKHDGGIVLADA